MIWTLQKNGCTAELGQAPEGPYYAHVTDRSCRPACEECRTGPCSHLLEDCVMTRYGPLSSKAGVLAIGDTERRHVLLTPSGVAEHDGATQAASFSWDDVERVILDVPRTRFRFPGAFSTIGLGAVAALLLDDPGASPDDGEIHIVVDGHTHVLAVSRHHVGGYWDRIVTHTQELLDLLVSSQESRDLLARPEEVIKLVTEATRRNR